MIKRLGLGVAIVAMAMPAFAAPAADSYGAIAFGPKTSSWGSTSGETSAADANKAALAYCARGASDCKVVASFSNTCAAVAISQTTDVTFVATDAKRGTAESHARQACLQKYPNGCRVAASICAMR
jgi:hypothetical protein